MTEVSIHTSAREVTDTDRRTGDSLHVSIHTSAREVTGILRTGTVQPYGFNPHFRKGSDKPDGAEAYIRQCFNPHFRKGSDIFFWNIINEQTVSIHTSAREVTSQVDSSSTTFSVSIHTSAREVTLVSGFLRVASAVSIHTSAREVTCKH